MRISDWSSDVCSSYLITFEPVEEEREARREIIAHRDHVDRAIAEAIGLKILFLLTLDHPHPGGIGPAIFEKLLERLGAEQVGEIAGIIAADDMMLLGPEVGEEAVGGQRVEKPVGDRIVHHCTPNFSLTRWAG